MCLYPTLQYNRRYTRTKKNGGVVPPCLDERTRWVSIGCQECMECRKQKARGWQIRLLEDIKHHRNGKFVTMTFSNESIKKLIWENEIKLDGYELDNKIGTVAMRLFLERYRKKYKKSLRHWMVTELGHNGTENIHLHGIIWPDKEEDGTEISLFEIERLWSYGWMWKYKIERGKRVNYVNEATVNYITKYLSKTDEKHKGYKGKVLTSPGIGRDYTDTIDSKKNRYNAEMPDKTKEEYRTRTGHKIAMPIYWRNKIYSENERQWLWIKKLDKEERWIQGTRISIKNGEERYYKVLMEAQKLNIELGYGTGEKDWARLQYETERRKMMYEKRLMPPAV